MSRIEIIKNCPRCHTEIRVSTVPDDVLVDPLPAPKLFVIRPCPNCGKNVFVWVGGRIVW